MAQHYAAFRPPLHALILQRAFSAGACFRNGLDIGCGTGYSTVALAAYCERVTGIDPSQAMLDHAQKHARITYRRGDGDHLSDLELSAMNVITFAGALFYTKTDRLREELKRVSRSGTIILVYDFEILLQEVVSELGLNGPTVASNYDHAANLSDWPEYRCEKREVERVPLAITEEQLAHILLSDSNRYAAFSEHLQQPDPFLALVTRLTDRKEKTPLGADIYWSRYTL